MDDQTPFTEEEQTSTPPNDEVNDIEHVRELILASHADIVPELVRGDSITDLIASIPAAQEAFSRILDSQPQPVTIPAGGNTPITIDIDSLPTSEKLRRGLAANRNRNS